MSNEVLEGPTPRPGGARRASKSSRRPRRRPRDERARRPRGSRTRRVLHRRAHGLGGTVGLTTLGAIIPGSGYLYTGRRALGFAVLGAWVLGLAAVAWYFGRDLRTALDVVFDPTKARLVAGGLGLLVLVWAFVVLTSHRLVRHRSRPRWHTVVGYVTAAVVVAAGAAPVLRAAQYALVTASAIEEVQPDNVKSATAPDLPEGADPWADKERVNVLLLGGDGGADRTGVRTDSVILASIDTVTGKTLLFSLPRNMMYAQFPDDSPLHDVYPDGFRTEQGDPAFDMLNAIYGQVPTLHPGVLGESDNEGADALKQAVSGSLGVDVDYYLMVSIDGFKEIVDAVGGITVNINEPVAINGDTDRGIPPTDYLDPGPDQHLDGFHALWFARGRYGSDDYARMDRQRCAIDALVEAADPSTVLTRYIDIVSAGKDLVSTDIPREIGPDFVSLLLKVKDAGVRSVVFRASDDFNSSDPDYDYVRTTVANAIDPPVRERTGEPKRVKETEDPVDVCAYQPVEDDADSSELALGG